MYSVTKIFHVPMGHRLSKHQGKCHNVHGHNLKIEVTVQSRTLNENDMVIDFSDLKKVVGNILESWDHGMFLNEVDEPNVKMICNMHTFNSDPTAEVLCKFLFEKLDNYFQGLKIGLSVKEVSIWEADDSKSTYYYSELI
jgi:6-pyruvoyltetrahydropterin/6-carboxytetrahydropterin synthase